MGKRFLFSPELSELLFSQPKNIAFSLCHLSLPLVSLFYFFPFFEAPCVLVVRKVHCVHQLYTGQVDLIIACVAFMWPCLTYDGNHLAQLKRGLRQQPPKANLFKCKRQRTWNKLTKIYIHIRHGMNCGKYYFSLVHYAQCK